MIKLIKGGVYYMGGSLVKENRAFMVEAKKQQAIKGTIAYSILKSHNKGDGENLRISFDALASHDITYVGIRQPRLRGSKSFPCPTRLQTATILSARWAAL